MGVRIVYCLYKVACFLLLDTILLLLLDTTGVESLVFSYHAIADDNMLSGAYHEPDAYLFSPEVDIGSHKASIQRLNWTDI